MNSQIGLIGLGVMGGALAKNLIRNGFVVSVFNRSYGATEKFKKEESGSFNAYENIVDFVNSLEKPRKIILMVAAGGAVDNMLDSLIGHLEKNDIIMDCGNSFFKDTIRRSKELEEKGIYFYGVGVSGGEKGALLGPSIMPGGNSKIYPKIAPFLEKMAAKKNNEPCCAYMGENGAGHYVKMVHNGIEYADMQIISEIYLFFKNALNLSNKEIACIFTEWNGTEVGSYLVEITSNILLEKDPLSEHDLVDMIVDVASQKGTGKWTILEATDISYNVSVIQSAVESRIISGFDEERKSFYNKFKNSKKMDISIEPLSVDEVRHAYYIGKLVAYAQGFSLMAKASGIYNWNLSLSSIASIFRAGCIIQANLLDKLMGLYDKEPHLKNFILSPSMLEVFSNQINALRRLNIIATLNEIANPALSSALIYVDQLKSKSIGANLIQAQRDYFGAHTFERIDREGAVHHEWENQ